MTVIQKFLLSGLLVLLIQGLSAREWTNQKGKTVEGDFVRLEGSKITLNIKGKDRTFPLASLSPEDQAFAKQAQEATDSGEEATQPAAGPITLGGVELKAGQLNQFELELSPENQELSAEGGRGWRDRWVLNYTGPWLKEMSKPVAVQKVKVLIGLPSNFDSSKATPIFFQWTSSDGKNNIAGANPYWASCNEKGWILIALDGLPDPASTWSNSVFYAGCKQLFEELHSVWPISKASPIAVGGFSGGSKITQWMAPLIAELPDTDVRGIWLGGCNEVFFDYAKQDLKVKNKTLRGLKAFISAGKDDDLANGEYPDRIKNGCKGARLKPIRLEFYEGGHRIHQDHLKEALDWFLIKE